jgi:hypothetical protein
VARALLGFETDEENVKTIHLVLLSYGEKWAILLDGSRFQDERSCLMIGDISNVAEDDSH